MLDRTESMAVEAVHNNGSGSAFCHTGIDNKRLLYRYCLYHLDQKQAAHSRRAYPH